MAERPKSKYIFVTALLVIYGVCGAQNFPAPKNIQQDQIRADVEYLASPELQGREAGTAGGRAAGSFIGKTIEECGLQAAYMPKTEHETGNYFQQFNITGAVSGNITGRLTFKSDSENLLPQQNTDYFYFYNQPDDVDLTGNPVFCGYGIVAPEYRYNDFRDKNLAGKIAVAYYGEPLENDSLVFFNGKKTTSFADPAGKARQIFKRGGKALILIPTPENSEKYQRFLKHAGSKAEKLSFVLDSEKTVPVIYLSAEFARRVFPEISEAAFNIAKKRLSSAFQSRETNLSFGMAFTMKYNDIS